MTDTPSFNFRHFIYPLILNNKLYNSEKVRDICGNNINLPDLAKAEEDAQKYFLLLEALGILPYLFVWTRHTIHILRGRVKYGHEGTDNVGIIEWADIVMELNNKEWIDHFVLNQTALNGNIRDRNPSDDLKMQQELRELLNQVQYHVQRQYGYEADRPMTKCMADVIKRFEQYTLTVKDPLTERHKQDLSNAFLNNIEDLMILKTEHLENQEREEKRLEHTNKGDCGGESGSNVPTNNQSHDEKLSTLPRKEDDDLKHGSNSDGNGGSA